MRERKILSMGRTPNEKDSVNEREEDAQFEREKDSPNEKDPHENR